MPEPTLGAYRFDNAEPASSTTASSSPKRPYRTAPESPLAIMAARRSTLSTSAPPKSAKRRNAIIPAVWTTPVLAVEAVRENVEAVREKTTNGSATSWHGRASMSAVEAPSHSP